MSYKDDRQLAEGFKKLLRTIEPPTFDDTWNAASGKRADRGGALSSLRWALGPTLAACAAVAVFAFEPSAPRMATPESIAKLESFSTQLTAVFISDDLGDGHADSAYMVGISGNEDGSKTEVAYRSLNPGQDLFVADTDFLLNYAIPSWDLENGRNM